MESRGMSSLPLIDMRAKNSTLSNPTLIVSHIQGPMHCIITHHVNPLESLKSFIDLSEQLRQKHTGQAVLMHAAWGFELPTGTVGRLVFWLRTFLCVCLSCSIDVVLQTFTQICICLSRIHVHWSRYWLLFIDGPNNLQYYSTTKMHSVI